MNVKHSGYFLKHNAMKSSNMHNSYTNMTTISIYR